MKERLTLSVETLRTNGVAKYEALMDKFESDYRAQLSTSFEDNVWKWLDWTQVCSCSSYNGFALGFNGN